MADNLQARIAATFRQDKIWAIGFVTVLWTTLLFVLLAVRPYIPHSAIEVAAWIALSAVGLFNTASIAAMIRHYAHDRDHIYSLDIRHLDAMRRR